MSEGILPIDEVAPRVGAMGRSYVGVRPIPVERIVGTLDRSQGDFDRSFTPRPRHLRRRLASLRRRFPDGAVPPIQVVELGGAYFVIDGHHRVALARELRMEFLDAEITAIHTEYDVPSDVDVRILVHTDQQRRFETASGLRAPTQRIEFSRPYGYPELLEVIRAWGYQRSLAEGRLIPVDEVGPRWYAEVYEPGVRAIDRAELPQAFAYKTDADLFMWVYQLHRTGLVDDLDRSFEDAARQARRQHVSRRFRRRFLRERTAPLRRRHDAAQR